MRSFWCAGALALLSCGHATYITLDLRADADVCPKINDSGVVTTAVKDVSNSTDYPLMEFQTGCRDGQLGTLIISPHDDSTGARNARVGIRVVAGLNENTASRCDDPDGRVGADCIIAIREVTFVEGANVPLTVTLTSACANVSCPEGFECDPNAASDDQRCIARDVLSPGGRAPDAGH